MSWEFIPTEFLSEADTWVELFNNGKLPYNAMIRNLRRFSKLGLFKDKDFINKLSSAIKDPEFVKKSKIQPFQLMIALFALSNDHTISHSTSINNALDEAIKVSFDNVKSSGKRIMQAFDVSGSMDQPVLKSPITAAQAEVVLGSVINGSEDKVDNYTFSDSGSRSWYFSSDSKLEPISIGYDEPVMDIFHKIDKLYREFTGTDCSLPMTYALENDIMVDAFIVYTDSETWSGKIHPMEALKKYRESTGINAKLIVVGLTATEFSIADPDDKNSLDIVGFDPSMHKVITEFLEL